MPNDMRDRLINLLNEKQYQGNATDTGLNYIQNSEIADYLIANGVIVPPCKVGDTLYSIMECSCEDIDGVYTICEFYNERAEDSCTLPRGKCPHRYRIAKVLVTDYNLLHFTAKWGETAFPTPEEAENALKECEN